MFTATPGLNHMQKVTGYLDRFLTANRFYKDESSIQLKPLEFYFIEPQVGQQQLLSLMMPATRMTIALNLVTYEYNPIGDMISERAVHYWDLEMIKSQKKRKKQPRTTRIGELTQSPTI
ncbi:hypothetical protein PIB30_010926 [Stylosanthes scabra]|uniref:Uncharacterized protein n=1 Tax=Stylosanthes scabra TaxID=79078 RepID=A0ABU6T7R1_9FABA|nr:hypothetical protein [Stylosanthes scabra]